MPIKKPGGSGRRYPVGAEPCDGAAHFRVWAPASNTAAVVLVDEDNRQLRPAHPLTRTASDYFEGLVPDVTAGSRYWIELDRGQRYADPASRFQPQGPDGPSEVIDPESFSWTDSEWRGVNESLIVYEMHVGTFTPAGTWASAIEALPELATLGISLIEVLPVADFPGEFGWGYDGVLPFAPTRLYGRPDDFRRFIDAAHRHRIAVILDVVYNHLGPNSCHFKQFSPTYFAHPTDWGEGLNFDGPGSWPVREFILANARYWITEFHVDGLRLDATQSILDSSTPHIVAEISDAVRAAAGTKRTWIVAEHEPQHTHLMRPRAEGGYGIDALWNDDVHHSAMVALTGRREAYYTDYRGDPQEFISAAKRGFLYQGQWYSWQKQPRGTSTRGIPAQAFVAFLQNHDQIANSSGGERLHRIGSPGKCRALTALLLLGPWTPMLFQGQEFEASSRFLYFADHPGELGHAVMNGRLEFLSQFVSLAGPEAARQVPVPTSPETFAGCKLNPDERKTHLHAVARHRSLIALRRSDPAFHDRTRFSVDGAVLGPTAFVLRFSDGTSAADCDADRLLLVNLGSELILPILPEPLLSAHPRTGWVVVWSSEDPKYGGPGIAETVFRDDWRLPPDCAIVVAPDPSS